MDLRVQRLTHSIFLLDGSVAIVSFLMDLRVQRLTYSIFLLDGSAVLASFLMESLFWARRRMALACMVDMSHSLDSSQGVCAGLCKVPNNTRGTQGVQTVAHVVQKLQRLSCRAVPRLLLEKRPGCMI